MWPINFKFINKKELIILNVSVHCHCVGVILFHKKSFLIINNHNHTQTKGILCFLSDFSLICSNCFSVDIMRVVTSSESIGCIFLFSGFAFGKFTLPKRLMISFLLNWPAVNTGGIGFVIS